MALKNDGTVWAWGRNNVGMLGDGTRTNRTSPVQVVGLPKIKSIATGRYHSMAISTNGEVYAWGYNFKGELGNGTFNNDSTVPIKITSLSHVKEIACGYYLSMFLKEDGTVYACGENEFPGRLGDGTEINRYTPVQVLGLSDVLCIRASDYKRMALTRNGDVWVWGCTEATYVDEGYPYYSTEESIVPIKMTGISRVKDIACSSFYILVIRDLIYN